MTDTKFTDHFRADPHPSVPTLESLGFEGKALSDLQKSLNSPVGVTFFAGTTGSGKTSSLESAVNYTVREALGRQDHVRILRAGIPFSRRDFTLGLRCDPDIVVFEDVRDSEIAEEVINTAMSGMKVFAEIHASDAFHIPTRLKALGVAMEDLDCVRPTYVRQTLSSSVCKQCSLGLGDLSGSEEAFWEVEQLQRISRIISDDLKPNLRFRPRVGCKHCVQGRAERTAVAEVVVPDEHMSSLLREGRLEDAVTYHRNTGGRTALEYGVSKALRGILDLRDLESRLDRLDFMPGLDHGAQVTCDPLL